MKCKQTGRCALLVICVLQMVSTGERQLFDFLGRMWLPILCNFFNFIFVIFGFFGAYQYKPKYIIIYLSWMLIWLAWNVFVICFYLNAGSLSNDSDWLNFGTGSASWWEVNGIGCDPVYPTNLTQVDVLRPLRPDVVKGCVLNYEYVETIHAAFQCIFSVIGMAVSVYLLKKFWSLNENCKKKPASIYYVEYSSPTRDGSESPDLDVEENYQQPMTPRRVKRQNRYRSSGKSQGRGTQQRSNNNNNQWRGTQTRGSQKLRRPKYLNPVRQLIDNANESSTSTDSTFRLPTSQVRPISFGGRQGHSNPTYVHSRPSSTYSLNAQEPVERPPSVHSSYSNYHGQRPSLNPNPTANGNAGYRNSAFLGSVQRKNNLPKSTFRPEIRARPAQPSYYGTSAASTFSGESFSENERPPPYMFGVNSETVI